MSNQQLHQKPRSQKSKSDDWESPWDWCRDLWDTYNINPQIDVCATLYNTKCQIYITPELDALTMDWNCGFKYGKVPDEWMNPPHTMTKYFIPKAFEQWQKYNMNIMAVIPANSMCTKYSKKYIYGSAEYHPIFTRPTFLRDGKPSEFNSRNGYFVVIWRKQ